MSCVCQLQEGAARTGRTEECFSMEPWFTQQPESHHLAQTGLELTLPNSSHRCYHMCTFTPSAEVVHVHL